MKKFPAIYFSNLFRYLLIPAIVFIFTANAATANNRPLKLSADTSIEGRWDMTVMMDGKEKPSWLEIRHSGTHRFFGYFVGDGGSARPVSSVKYNNGKISFTVPPQWEKEENDIVIEGTLQDGILSGTMIGANGKTYTWTAVRAPSLKRDKAPVWGKPIKLFNGKDLTGWHMFGTKPSHWVAENGVLRSLESGANLVSDQKFNDFKLHVEFRYPKGSNSGIYLRGRYEVQIIDSLNAPPLSIYLGGVYGFIDPREMVAKAAGEWQYFDITFIGRIVTIVANGKLIINDREIPGITGGALDSKEGEPGPLQIQGDHGPVELRNILITPAK